MMAAIGLSRPSTRREMSGPTPPSPHHILYAPGGTTPANEEITIVDISLDFENLGTVPISGTVRIEVQGPLGEIVEEFDHVVADLAASA
jgi:hypothetical protein